MTAHIISIIFPLVLLYVGCEGQSFCISFPPFFNVFFLPFFCWNMKWKETKQERKKQNMTKEKQNRNKKNEKYYKENGKKYK